MKSVTRSAANEDFEKKEKVNAKLAIDSGEKPNEKKQTTEKKMETKRMKNELSAR